MYTTKPQVEYSSVSLSPTHTNKVLIGEKAETMLRQRDSKCGKTPIYEVFYFSVFCKKDVLRQFAVSELLIFGATVSTILV